jgi:hypothetical protein
VILTFYGNNVACSKKPIYGNPVNKWVNWLTTTIITVGKSIFNKHTSQCQLTFLPHKKGRGAPIYGIAFHRGSLFNFRSTSSLIASMFHPLQYRHRVVPALSNTPEIPRSNITYAALAVLLRCSTFFNIATMYSNLGGLECCKVLDGPQSLLQNRGWADGWLCGSWLPL